MGGKFGGRGVEDAVQGGWGGVKGSQVWGGGREKRASLAMVQHTLVPTPALVPLPPFSSRGWGLATPNFFPEDHPALRESPLSAPPPR